MFMPNRVALRLTAFIAAMAALTASTNATVLLTEDFSYADGPITSVSAGAWTLTSGTDSGATALNITTARAIINQGDTHGSGADANRLMTTSFNPLTDNTTKLYALFTVNFSALPVSGDSDGSYFAHFKSSTANEFYSRIGANTNGAASGFFRLAVSNEIWNTTLASTVEYPLDLSLGTTYTVVARLDLATDQTTLWINPTSESSTSVTATDAFTYAGLINAFALRQGTSGTGAPGILAVDGLRVATAFTDLVTAVPETGSFLLVGVMGLAYLGIRRVRR